MRNFKKYKLPEIFWKENEDPCDVKIKLELRKYQEFIGKYLGPKSPYSEILLYHGLGSGKTATSINLMNVLYNYDANYNFVILIKASLRDDPWMTDLKKWLGKDSGESEHQDITRLDRYKSIHFVHYDSPFADRDFITVMKTVDSFKPTLYIIDEAHNFIRNVYSNINSKIGKRAQVIYEYIIKERKENSKTKIVLISATPGVNTPFELSLMFNLLRPGVFPSSEYDFNRTFITDSNYPILNPLKKNMFERRIIGLVSYYVGATADLYAKQELSYVNLTMSSYQYNVYRVFEKLEEEIQKRAKKTGKQSQLYRTYTRQACNFVFPNVSGTIAGELRPRPNKFKIVDQVADNIEKGKNKDTNVFDNIDIKDAVAKYLNALDTFIKGTEEYFMDVHRTDVQNKRTIQDDLKEFKDGFKGFEEKFINFYQSKGKKSKLFEEMYKCSPKMTAIVFMVHVCPGKAMIYTNYVVMEGIDMLKVYFRLIGFNDFRVSKENMGYCEYHGRIDRHDREKIKTMFNDKNNIKGNKCKVILLSPSATEGIQLLNILQEHITEPYWNEVRIKQVVGRGVRQCSHKDLPLNERVVKIYRYKVIKPDKLDDDDIYRASTDEYIEDQAKARDNLIDSFLSAMKEVAVDCTLFQAHNMMTQKYNCFGFPQQSVIGKNIGPAYKEDIKEDIKNDSGLHAKNSKVETIKVIKISGVYIVNNDANSPTYSQKEFYWYDQKSHMVYDYETHYPVGNVDIIDNLPNKLDKTTYIITVTVDIPVLREN